MVWTKLALLIGGAAVCMCGLLWWRGGQLLEVFGKQAKAETGFKVAMVGFGMMLVGVALLYLVP